MSKVLYIEASPRKERSKSIAVARAFLDEYQSQNPGDEIVTLDLWARELPEFNDDTINAKYQVLHGADFDADQAAAWQAVIDLCNEFKDADKYVMSLPMWNFGIPYKLKHFIDLIAQPGQTFSFSPETGYAGLVTGKPIAVVYARGGTYSDEATKGMDFQRSYLEFLLGFIGFTDIHSLMAEPTLGAPAAVEAAELQWIQNAKELAVRF